MKELKGTLAINSKRHGKEITFSYTWESVIGIKDEHIEMLHKCAKAYITAVEQLGNTTGGLLPKYNPPLDYYGTFEKII